METEFKDGILNLRPTNDKEQRFLEKAWKEGLRLFGGGTSFVCSLPSEAQLTQLHVTSTQMTMLIYALGLADNDLRRSYGKEITDELLTRLVEVMTR
jgi:hypothetical protein